MSVPSDCFLSEPVVCLHLEMALGKQTLKPCLHHSLATGFQQCHEPSLLIQEPGVLSFASIACLCVHPHLSVAQKFAFEFM